MKVSYIVPVWINDEETLQIVKNAIESFKQAPGELVLFDNGSTIGGGYLRSEASVYIRVPHNVGYTPAIRYGVSVASGELLAIVNDDIRLAPNWREVAGEILSDPSVATVHPKMTDYEVPYSFGDLVAKEDKERWCQNSCVFTTKAFLDEMAQKEPDEPYPGMFDLNFGIGGGADDWDFYFRVRKLGYKTAYTNKTCFQHLHSFSLKKLPQRGEIVKQNREYFYTKHGFYPEEEFARRFPAQMTLDWKEGFI